MKNTEKILEYYKQFGKTFKNVDYSSSSEYSDSEDDGFPSPSRKQKENLNKKMDDIQERLKKIETFIMQKNTKS